MTIVTRRFATTKRTTKQSPEADSLSRRSTMQTHGLLGPMRVRRWTPATGCEGLAGLWGCRNLRCAVGHERRQWCDQRGDEKFVSNPRRNGNRHGGDVRSGGWNDPVWKPTGKECELSFYAKYRNQGSMPGLGAADGADAWHLLTGGFRADEGFSAEDKLTLEGDLYGGREGVPACILPSVISPAPLQMNTPGPLVRRLPANELGPRRFRSIR